MPARKGPKKANRYTLEMKRTERGVLTDRFTYRGCVIRIFGAGFWRKGKSICDRENQVHK